jgi:hypothetical protein
MDRQSSEQELRSATIRAARLAGMIVLGIIIGYTWAIIPATTVAALVGPIDRSKWWVAGILAATPYLLVALVGVLSWRRGRGRQHPLISALTLASLLAAAGSSVLFFLATLDSQF